MIQEEKREKELDSQQFVSDLFGYLVFAGCFEISEQKRQRTCLVLPGLFVSLPTSDETEQASGREAERGNGSINCSGLLSVELSRPFLIIFGQTHPQF